MTASAAKVTPNTGRASAAKMKVNTGRIQVAKAAATPSLFEFSLIAKSLGSPEDTAATSPQDLISTCFSQATVKVHTSTGLLAAI